MALVLLLGPADHAQDGATSPPVADVPDVGYVEGRILELTPASRGAPIGAGGMALVRLADGLLVNAIVPSTEDLGATVVDAYRVGDRVELYYAPTPGGTVREYVVVDWIRRPALYLLVGLFLLVNTLVLAYVGAGLPLLVLLSVGDYSWVRALNIEQVAAEVVHTLVGSIGLILGVPITTALAAVMFRGGRLKLREGELDHAHHHH